MTYNQCETTAPPPHLPVLYERTDSRIYSLTIAISPRLTNNISLVNVTCCRPLAKERPTSTEHYDRVQLFRAYFTYLNP